ncbi:Protein phosphatase 2C 56 [Forsythia ovata]|uniref:Protein phosphatase 2C 56 n=1 Tax=Forsythia ovata TaxID=205694 RepID=A0ABD1TU56_9LAMI
MGTGMGSGSDPSNLKRIQHRESPLVDVEVAGRERESQKCRVSNYCAASLHNFVAEEWEREKNDANGSSQKWEHVLSRAFTRADDALEDGIVAPRTVGSTALVVIVSACQIIVSNCGDCRAVLCRGNAILSLTRDHKPNRSDEVERIKNGGGRIIFFQGERVEGMLAVTRSIGDHYLKQWVTSNA